MAIIVLRAWYLDSVLSVAQVQHTNPDLRLSRTGLLKTAMRADFLDDVEQVKQSLWFQRYLEGELVEFYIEGSGAYSISNLDLISREMYFNKRNTLTTIEPMIVYCGQAVDDESSQAISRVLTTLVETVNRKQSPLLPLQLEVVIEDGGLTLDAALVRKLKHALLVVADVTPIAALPDQRLLPSPHVCVAVGYALQSKRPDQILLVQLERQGYQGRFPFEVEGSSYLSLKDAKQLQEQLTTTVLRQLQRAKLIS
ncbi:MAG: hypothetical protein NW237_01140 [Cyanobacteriota bacterium]|nr:hypothetical protein [Cyanobacteriota bacterium]